MSSSGLLCSPHVLSHSMGVMSGTVKLPKDSMIHKTASMGDRIGRDWSCTQRVGGLGSPLSALLSPRQKRAVNPCTAPLEEIFFFSGHFPPRMGRTFVAPGGRHMMSFRNASVTICHSCVHRTQPMTNQNEYIVWRQIAFRKIVKKS